MAQPGLKGQLFSRSSILATPALQGLPLGGVRAISGGRSSQVASQEFAQAKRLRNKSKVTHKQPKTYESLVICTF